MLINVPQTISIALGAAMITITGYRTLLLAMTTVMALADAWLLTRPNSTMHPRKPVPATRTRPQHGSPPLSPDPPTEPPTAGSALRTRDARPPHGVVTTDAVTLNSSSVVPSIWVKSRGPPLSTRVLTFTRG